MLHYQYTYIVSLIDACNIEADHSSTLTVGADITSSLGNIMNYTSCVHFFSHIEKGTSASVDTATPGTL